MSTISRLNNYQRFFILTGGPGSGKSTLIDRLELMGYERSSEAGRGIIQDQVKIGGHALPWDDPIIFAEQMLTWEMRSCQIAQKTTGTVFFDRGIPDVAGYLQLLGHKIPDHVKSAIKLFRYNRNVFILPPWKEIFCGDSERKQSFEESIQTYESLVKCYKVYGYHLIELPCTTIDKRIAFLLSKLSSLTEETVH